MSTRPALAGRIAIRVHGQPIPQGSMVAFIDKATHRARLKSSNEKTLNAWRKTITTAAVDQCRYVETTTAPVRVWIRFTFERPKTHYYTGRNSHILRDDAPPFPGRSCGDLDKLVRAALDAITGPLIHDDTQVVDVRARKMYAGEDEYALDRAGVDIILEPLEAAA